MSKYSHKRLRGQASGDPRCREAEEERPAMEAAMARHEGLIHAFIRRQGGGAIPYEEALQAGRVGLWRALHKYDASRGTAFSTYAWVVICRHVHRAVAERERERERGEWPEGLPPMRPVPQPEEWVEQRLILEALSDVWEQLPERLRRIIVARYGLSRIRSGFPADG